MKPIKFQDVAHLYLGCEVVLSKGNLASGFGGGLPNVKISEGVPSLFDGWSYWAVSKNWPFYEKYLRPILKHLDDLTEQDAKELYKIVRGKEWSPMGYNQPPNALAWWQREDEAYMATGKFYTGDTSVWLWLLKNSYDLFGLIDSGEAIRKGGHQ